MPSNRTPTTFIGPETVPNTETLAYTVPGGKIAVVRWISVYCESASGIALGVGGTTVPETFAFIPTDGVTINPDKWVYQPLAAGETIYYQANSVGDLTVTVTGDLYDA